MKDPTTIRKVKPQHPVKEREDRVREALWRITMLSLPETQFHKASKDGGEKQVLDVVPGGLLTEEYETLCGLGTFFSI